MGYDVVTHLRKGLDMGFLIITLVGLGLAIWAGIGDWYTNRPYQKYVYPHAPGWEPGRDERWMQWFAECDAIDELRLAAGIEPAKEPAGVDRYFWPKKTSSNGTGSYA